MEQRVVKVECGCHEGRVGFTQTYADGTRQHILFTPDLAERLAWELLKLCEGLERQSVPPPGGPGDGLGVSDGCSLSLSPPKEE